MTAIGDTHAQRRDAEQARFMSGAVPERAIAQAAHNVTASFIDQLWSDQNNRHAWLERASDQIKAWKEQDKLNGIEWEDNDGRD